MLVLERCIDVFTTLQHPAAKNYDLSAVKTLVSGAAPLSAEITHQVARVLCNAAIGQGYGMTETCASVALPQVDMRIGTPGSGGVILPGTAVRIRKADGTWGKRGEQGELVVTGPSMALGYLDNEEATRETFQDGWVHTGDEGYVDEKNQIFIVDRIKVPIGLAHLLYILLRYFAFSHMQELIKVRGFQGLCILCRDKPRTQFLALLSRPCGARGSPPRSPRYCRRVRCRRVG